MTMVTSTVLKGHTPLQGGPTARTTAPWPWRCTPCSQVCAHVWCVGCCVFDVSNCHMFSVLVLLLYIVYILPFLCCISNVVFRMLYFECRLSSVVFRVLYFMFQLKLDIFVVRCCIFNTFFV